MNKHVTRRSRFVTCASVVTVGLLLLTLAGCGGTGSSPTSPTPPAASGESAPQSSASSTTPAASGETTPQPSASPNHTVTLPDGKVISATDPEPTPWKDVTLKLDMLGIGPTGDPVETLVGNHARVLSKEEVTVPAGKVTLALVERTEPAASGSAKATREYWLISLRDDPQHAGMKLAYTITAVITGNEQAARDEVLQVGQTWKLPEH